MKLYLTYDTETSGFPSDKIPANDPKQAWIVQFAAKLMNEEGQLIMSVNVLQKSYGREIGKYALAVHNTPTEKCDMFGVSKQELYDILLTMFKLTDVAICHNVGFDGKMLAKFAASFEDHELYDNVKSTPTFCTMVSTTQFCGLTQKNNRTPKWPKLEELYAILFNGEEFENAHDAMADVNATVKCFLHPAVQELFNKARG